jgi:hypothetical protein
MRKQYLYSVSALFGAFLALAPPGALADDANLLRDASFEQRLPADEGGWDLFEISLYSKNYARSGSLSMFNGGFSRTVAYPPYFIGNVSGAYQEFPAEPGSRWRLSGYGLLPAALEGSSAFGILQLSFFDADGEDLGTLETAGTDTKAMTSGELDSGSAVGEWTLLDTGIATAPDGTATVQAFTLFVDFAGKSQTQGVYFDDLVLCAITDESSDCGPD